MSWTDGERIARLESQIDSLFNGRLDRIDNRIERHNATVHDRIDGTDAKVDGLKTTGLVAAATIIALLAGNLILSVMKLASG
jgi:hypothetical protein